jgi:WD40 repeat protein
MSSGQLLTTFLFPTPIYAVTWTPTETVLFAAGGAAATENSETPVGTIFKVDLYKSSKAAAGSYDRMESGSIRNVGMGCADDAAFKGHSSHVTSLALNFDGTLLLSGAADGSIIIWDVLSRQPLNTVSLFTGPVTNLTIILRTEGAFNRSHASRSKASQQNLFRPFKKNMMSKESAAESTSPWVSMHHQIDMEDMLGECDSWHEL